MHGATAMASSDLGFVPADFPGDAVSLVAPCGDLWGLRYDLRYPFASYLAHQAALLGTGKLLHILHICSADWKVFVDDNDVEVAWKPPYNFSLFYNP